MGLFYCCGASFWLSSGLIGRALNARMDRSGAEDEADREPQSYSSAGRKR